MNEKKLNIFSNQGSYTSTLSSRDRIKSLCSLIKKTQVPIRWMSYILSAESYNSPQRATSSVNKQALPLALAISEAPKVAADRRLRHAPVRASSTHQPCGSLALWPGSSLFPSVRFAAQDITGSCYNHNVILLGIKPISFPPSPFTAQWVS